MEEGIIEAKGSKRETYTNKVGCGFKLRFRAILDGQELEVVEFKAEHDNHIPNAEEIPLLPSERKLNQDTQKEIENMVKLGANRKLIQQEFSEKTGKTILMKDIHNIASRTKQTLSSQSSAQDLADWITNRISSARYRNSS